MTEAGVVVTAGIAGWEGPTDQPVDAREAEQDRRPEYHYSKGVIKNLKIHEKLAKLNTPKISRNQKAHI